MRSLVTALWLYVIAQIILLLTHFVTFQQVLITAERKRASRTTILVNRKACILKKFDLVQNKTLAKTSLRNRVYFFDRPLITCLRFVVKSGCDL